MRITDETRFPNPVLTDQTNDFSTGTFAVGFQGIEKPNSGAVTLNYETVLTEPAIRALVLKGDAAAGCVIRCNDTYYSQLHRLSLPAGRLDFSPGTLLGRVTLRPIVWTERELPNWDSGTIHQEFAPPLQLATAAILAVADEFVMSVGQAKFTPLESIFELRPSDEVPIGSIVVDLDGDRIVILAATAIFKVLESLRGQATYAPVLMSSLYLPTVMEVLDLLREGREQHEGRRWLEPFLAKCDAVGLPREGEFSSLEAAQRLLEAPLQALSRLVSEDDH